MRQISLTVTFLEQIRPEPASAKAGVTDYIAFAIE